MQKIIIWICLSFLFCGQGYLIYKVRDQKKILDETLITYIEYVKMLKNMEETIISSMDWRDSVDKQFQILNEMGKDQSHFIHFLNMEKEEHQHYLKEFARILLQHKNRLDDHIRHNQ